MINRYFEINENGNNIRCKIYCNDLHNIKKVVIFGHGFCGHKDNKAAEKFAGRVMTKYKNIAVITYNFPCHGDDVKKKLYLSDCIEYLDLVINYVKKTYTEEELYAYATSFGGFLVLTYIAQKGNPFRKIALRCPVINMYESLTQTIIKPDELEMIEKGKPVPIGFDRKIAVNQDFLNELKNIDLMNVDFIDHADDIIIMHGTDDEVIKPASVRDFAENNVIEFIPIEGADHRFQNPNHMESAIKCILEFFAF